MKYINDLLVNSSAILPIAYASWIFHGDEVFVSDKLSAIIDTTCNLVEPDAFVKLMRKVFGSFLDVAIEKISKPNAIRNEYSSAMEIDSNCVTLKLIFDKSKQIYMFTVSDTLRKNEKKAEQSLVEMKEILDNLPIYIWKKNKDSRMMYCNKMYANALGVTKECVTTNNMDLISPNENATVNRKLCITKQQESVKSIVINGSRRLLSIMEIPFVDSGDFIGIAMDITDKKELQKEYTDYKLQTEETLNNSSVPIAIFDKNTLLVFANLAIIKLFSIEKLDLFNNCKFSDVMDHLINNESIMTTSDILKYKSKIIKLFQTITDPYHATVNLRNGKTLNVAISPNREGGLIFMFEDLTNEIALKREINSMSTVHAEILEHLSDGVLVFGGDNKIRISNSVINEIWNCPDQITDFFEMHIKNFFELKSGLFASITELELFISKLIDTSTKRIIFSGKITLSNEKTISYFCAPLPEGLNLVKFSDITDIINLERTLRERNNAISQVDKLKAKLISNISNELQSPLKTICGFTEILCNQYFGKMNEKQFEYCYGIFQSAEQVFNVVDAIINHAAIESGQVKMKYIEVNLLNFINELIYSFKDKLNVKKISLKTNFKNSSIKIFIDKVLMTQALSQLISRAIQVTAHNGTVKISVEFPKSDQNSFCLAIHDCGIGLSKEKLEKFEKMFNGNGSTTNNTSEFSFTLVNSIVKLHHGKMLINSKPEKGTDIKCILPINQT
jgi:signal transduction histidine kinase